MRSAHSTRFPPALQAFLPKACKTEYKLYIFHSFYRIYACQSAKLFYNKSRQPPEHTMTTYFILDRNSNTWSDSHYPLSSILATPGITEEHILANARTQQTLTVAQARSMATQQPARKKPSTPAASALRIAGYNTQKPAMNKTLVGGMSLNRNNKADRKPGGHLTLSDIPKKSGREYKVISQHDAVFQGQFNAQKLNQVLNKHAQRGWRVISCTTAPVYTEDGTERQEMMIVLEKDEK